MYLLKKKFRNYISLKNLSHRFILFFMLMFLLINMVKAQKQVSLKQAILSGLNHKKSNQSDKLNVSIALLQTKALYRKYLPQVSAEYNFLYNPILQTSILPIGVFNPAYPIDATKSVQFGTNWTQTAGLSATQTLLDLFIIKQINEFKLKERIAILSQAQTEYELVYQIAQSYIQIYLDEAKILALVSDTNRTFLSYDMMKNQFDKQRLLKSDLNKAIINHNNSLQSLHTGLVLLIENKVNLLYLMGIDDINEFDFEIDSMFSLNSSYLWVIQPNSIQFIPELQSLLIQDELSQIQTKTEMSKHYPVIALKGYLGANQFSNSFNPTDENTWFGLSYVGLNVKVPILTGENQMNKISQIKLQSQQFNYQKEDKIKFYEKESLLAKTKMENLSEQIKIQSINLNLLDESVSISQARVSEGKESAYSLNLEEVELQLMQSNYHVSQKQLWVYWLDYLKSSGQLFVLWN